MNHSELAELCRRINALPEPTPRDAYGAAIMTDLHGLAYIANIADGIPAHSARPFGVMLDLADMLRGVTPRTVFGIDRSYVPEPTQDEIDAMQSEAAHRARLADAESICPHEVNDMEAERIQSEKGVRE